MDSILKFTSFVDPCSESFDDACFQACNAQITFVDRTTAAADLVTFGPNTANPAPSSTINCECDEYIVTNAQLTSVAYGNMNVFEIVGQSTPFSSVTVQRLPTTGLSITWVSAGTMAPFNLSSDTCSAYYVQIGGPEVLDQPVGQPAMPNWWAVGAGCVVFVILICTLCMFCEFLLVTRRKIGSKSSPQQPSSSPMMDYHYHSSSARISPMSSDPAKVMVKDPIRNIKTNNKYLESGSPKYFNKYNEPITKPPLEV